jgi:hypothetical protein
MRLGMVEMDEEYGWFPNVETPEFCDECGMSRMAHIAYPDHHPFTSGS